MAGILPRIMSSLKIETRRKRMQLMDLPVELIERILDFVLVLDEPVELSPLAEIHTCYCRGRQMQFDPSSHGYMMHPYPKLDVLQTCKTAHEIGVRVCYSKNMFRFSNRLGCFMLKVFLEIIGTINADLLRSMVVCCPTNAYTIADLGEEGWSYTDPLLPFGTRRLVQRPHDTYGMADLPPPMEMLPVIESLQKLTTATFLIYYTELWALMAESYFTSPAATSTVKCSIAHLHADRNKVFLLSEPERTPPGFEESRKPWWVGERPKVEHCAMLLQAGWQLCDRTFAEYDPRSVRDPYVSDDEALAIRQEYDRE